MGGIATDAREATTIQRLRFDDPQKHANVLAAARPEYQQPDFDLERDAQTGQHLVDFSHDLDENKGVTEL